MESDKSFIDVEDEKLNNNCDIVNENLTEEAAIPAWKACINRFLHLKIELTILMVFLCNSLIDAVSTDLILTSTCVTTFNFPSNSCSNDMPDSVKNIVQPYASKVIMAKTLIDALFPSVISLFIGPWMDIHGRKPFLILPLIGYFISYLFWLGLSYKNSLSPFYYLIPSIPSSVTGGLVAIQACSFSYLADTVAVQMRALRMSILALFMGLGTTFGYLIVNAYSSSHKDQLALYIFGTATGITLLNALYTTFVIKETVQNNQENEASIGQKIRSFFNVHHIKESLKVLVTKKPNHGRPLVLLLVPVIVFSIIIEQGEAPYFLLITKKVFSWTLEDYNSFRSSMVLIGVLIGAPLIFVLKRLIKVTDLTLLFIITTMQLVSSIILSLANATAMLYVGKALGVFVDFIKAAAKTKMSYIVLASDIGKVFVVVSMMEAIAPLIATPIYAAVYSSVLAYKPMALFYLSFGFAVIIIISLIIIKIVELKYGIIEKRTNPTDN
ncbi:hypothetical protein O3M35_008113 [Rhynocoris fuscipes]|uniref:Proton-coupled folate transporter n=1 Tax=Rhynocoris fuscipes TaxID=488301 RepID=A0AAW1D576_9HEMI